MKLRKAYALLDRGALVGERANPDAKFELAPLITAFELLPLESVRFLLMFPYCDTA
jgi:hypothetical protein